ncbi:MAG: EAL domain-containing protein [Spirulinaceae cyanobacterium]
MRTTRQIKAEIEAQLGLFPPFFAPALDNPEILASLRQQTLSAYVENPLPDLLKEKFCTYLSRYCSVASCLIFHCSILNDLGISPSQILQFLQEPATHDFVTLQTDLHLLKQSSFSQLPETDSEHESSLLRVGVFIFLYPHQSSQCASALRRFLGEEKYLHLVNLFAFIKVCHQWAGNYPELASEMKNYPKISSDRRKLIEKEPRLEEFWNRYQPLVPQEVDSLLDNTELEQIVQQRTANLSASNQLLREEVKSLITDITERKRAEEELRTSEKKYRTLIEMMNEGLSLTDQQGRLYFVNRRYCEILGYSSAELVGKPEKNLLVNRIDNRLLNRKRQQCQLGISQQYEIQVQQKSGNKLWWLVSRTPLTNDSSMEIVTDITQRKQAEEALQESQQRLHSILASLEDVIWSASAQTFQLLYLNPAAEEVYGRPIADLVNNSNLGIEIVYPEDRQAVRRALQSLHQEGSMNVEYRIVRPNGEIRWLRDRTRLIYSNDGTPVRIDGIATDITEHKQTEEALREAEEKYRSIFENAIEGIFRTTPDGYYLDVNPAFARMLGYNSPQELMAKIQDIGSQLYINPQKREEFIALMAQNESITNFEFEAYCQDGSKIWISENVRNVKDSEGHLLYYEGTFEDITKRKEVEEQLLRNAFYDPLTGIANRSLFMDRLQSQLIHSQRKGGIVFAVLFIDLDRFKAVNDSLGHLVGDQLLIGISQRLEDCISSRDTVARLSGDEFAILLNKISQVEDATRVADHIQQQLSLPFHLQGHEVFASASIGIALSYNGATGKPYKEPKDLLKDADRAMYQAKHLGKARYEIFDNSMQTDLPSGLELETDLRKALERQEIKLHYQPIISLRSGKVTSLEVLVRWQHSQRGLIYPQDFLPLAEETGLIVKIDNLVLRQACQQMFLWQSQGLLDKQVTISVNVTGKQFAQKNFVEEIEEALDYSGLKAQNLCLEITESLIMENIESVTAKLFLLQKLGVELSIDDFGTGYSSLSRLKIFPINTLKIDRSFISQLEISLENKEIVKTIINLGLNLGIKVVAEGIETQAQQKGLKALGCHFGQGYLYSRPVDSEGISSWLQKSEV